MCSAVFGRVRQATDRQWPIRERFAPEHSTNAVDLCRRRAWSLCVRRNVAECFVYLNNIFRWSFFRIYCTASSFYFEGLFIHDLMENGPLNENEQKKNPLYYPNIASDKYISAVRSKKNRRKCTWNRSNFRLFAQQEIFDWTFSHFSRSSVSAIVIFWVIRFRDRMRIPIHIKSHRRAKTLLR